MELTFNDDLLREKDYTPLIELKHVLRKGR